jgi:hypothetical protein
MIQCPHCGHRTFEARITISARVRLIGREDGDYDEREVDSYARDWHTLDCCACRNLCDEEDARAAFEAATLCSGTPDDVYTFYEARQPTMRTVAEDDSLYSIAGAWNFWLWQQERKGA